MTMLWLKSNQETINVLSREIFMVLLEAQPMDMMEFTIALKEENTTGMIKGS